jgi:hypothetical protein
VALSSPFNGTGFLQLDSPLQSPDFPQVFCQDLLSSMPYALGQIVHGLVISTELIDIQHQHLAYLTDFQGEIGQYIEVILIAKSHAQWIVSCQTLMSTRSVSRLLQLHQANLPIWAKTLQWLADGVKVQVEAISVFIPLRHVTPKPSSTFVVKVISVSPLRLSYTCALVEQWANQTKILVVKVIESHCCQGDIEGVKSILLNADLSKIHKGDQLPVQFLYFDNEQACAYVNLQEQT